MSDLNPLAQAEVEAEIMRLSHELSSATEEYGHLAEEAARTDVAYDLARARALLDLPKVKDGEKITVAEREAQSLIVAESQFEAARMAEAVFKAAQERGRNLRTQLEALRTLAANIRAAVDYSHGRGG